MTGRTQAPLDRGRQQLAVPGSPTKKLRTATFSSTKNSPLQLPKKLYRFHIFKQRMLLCWQWVWWHFHCFHPAALNFASQFLQHFRFQFFVSCFLIIFLGGPFCSSIFAEFRQKNFGKIPCSKFTIFYYLFIVLAIPIFLDLLCNICIRKSIIIIKINIEHIANNKINFDFDISCFDIICVFSPSWHFVAFSPSWHYMCFFSFLTFCGIFSFLTFCVLTFCVLDILWFWHFMGLPKFSVRAFDNSSACFWLNNYI